MRYTDPADDAFIQLTQVESNLTYNITSKKSKKYNYIAKFE